MVKKKLIFVMKMLFHILRILTIILYLALNAEIIYLLSYTKYPAIKEVILIFSFTILIPSLLIGVLFVKKDNMILKILKGLIQLGLLAAVVYLALCAIVISMFIPSHTTNPANFEIKDKCVNELLQDQEFSMLPNTLPENITDVSYLYNWQYDFDYSCLTLDISWTYKEEADYLKAKSEMQVYESVDNKIVEDGFHMIYAIGNSKQDKKCFCFGYNDSTNRVTYQIDYEW